MQTFGNRKQHGEIKDREQVRKLTYTGAAMIRSAVGSFILSAVMRIIDKAKNRNAGVVRLIPDVTFAIQAEDRAKQADHEQNSGNGSHYVLQPVKHLQIYEEIAEKKEFMNCVSAARIMAAD